MDVKCSNCRRQLGKEMLTCPRREIGENSTCQFRVEHRRLSAKGLGGLLLFGLVMMLFPVLAYLYGKGLPLWVKGLLTPLLVVGGGFMITGIFQLFGSETILFNAQTGQSWQQITILGVPVTETVFGAIETIPWEGTPARVMRYPASVAAFYRQDTSPDIFSTALLYLLAKNVVQLGQMSVVTRMRRRKRVYVLRPGEAYASAEVRGHLEKRIWEVVGQAESVTNVFTFNGSFYPRQYRAALSLEDAVLMVFEGGQPHPGNYLVTALVGPDAEALGLGTIQGERTKKLSPGPNTKGKVALDIRSVEQLYRDFWTTTPEHAREILAQIDLFILTELPIKRG